MIAALSRKISGIIIVSLVISLLGCDGGAGLAGSTNSDKKKKAEKETDDSDEGELADEPADVSGGALLTCAYVDDSEADAVPQASSKTVGCAVIKDHQRLSNSHQFKLTLVENDRKTPVTMATAQPRVGSPWHMIAYLPLTHVSTGYLNMRVDDDYDVGMYTSKLSTSLDGLPDALSTSSDAMTLTSERKWNSGDVTITLIPTQPAFEYVAAVYPPDFCQNGVIATKLAPTNVLYQVVQALAGGTMSMNLEIVPGEPLVAGQQCYRPFGVIANTSDLTGGGKDWAQQTDDGRCIFVVTGNYDLHIIRADASKGVNLESVRTFVKRNPC